MLILASGSPRRQELLAAAGIPFTIRVPGVEEIRDPSESPDAYVRRLARAKAEAVDLHPGEIALGADTVVVVDGQLLEKPRDEEDASRMLSLLSGRNHRVLTGICLRSESRVIVDTAETLVHFSALDEDEIEAYVASGEPMDKAGGYAIQGLASRFVDRIEGCYANVVGLPVSLVYRHLREFGS